MGTRTIGRDIISITQSLVEEVGKASICSYCRNSVIPPVDGIGCRSKPGNIFCPRPLLDRKHPPTRNATAQLAMLFGLRAYKTFRSMLSTAQLFLRGLRCQVMQGKGDAAVGNSDRKRCWSEAVPVQGGCTCARATGCDPRIVHCHAGR